MRRVTPTITTLGANEIFVFGSNLAGRHGKGAALLARQKFGAVYGHGIGPQGRCYAIPTKDRHLKTLPLASIQKHVEEFLRRAKSTPELLFWVTEIGCGLAGYSAKEIAPMFRDAPNNCALPLSFMEVLK